MARKSRVAIIGRANVGKSTLFNRLTRGPRALVSVEAGTTRDRKEYECEWLGKYFILIDTGGLDVNATSAIGQKVAEQARAAADGADIILFVVDVKTGTTAADKRLATTLRPYREKIILVANKTDGARDEAAASEFYELGFGKPWPVSALTGAGTGDLLDAVVSRLTGSSVGENPGISIAVVGRPNVGKSSLVNALLGEERLIVHDEPYTTRDANSIPLTFFGERLSLIDTAGVRRKSKIDPLSIESQSAHQSLSSIEHADVVLFVTEAHLRVSAQDRQLAQLIDDSKASVVIVANKWDLIEDKNPTKVNEYESYYRTAVNFLSWAPVVFMSAKHKTKLTKLKQTILTVYRERFRRIDENALSKFLKSVVKKHPPTTGRGTRRPYIFRIKQADINPPQFVVYIKEDTSLRYSYLNVIEKQLRQQFGFEGSPIKIWIEKIRKST